MEIFAPAFSSLRSTESDIHVIVIFVGILGHHIILVVRSLRKLKKSAAAAIVDIFQADDEFS